MSPNTSPIIRKTLSAPLVQNRITGVLQHIPAYYFSPQKRLAQDTGLSRSTVSRIISGETVPSGMAMLAISAAIGHRLGKHIDPCELFSLDGTYPTPYICCLVDCEGCLPERICDAENRVRPEYRHIEPGKWSLPLTSLPKASGSSNQPANKSIRNPTTP